MGKPERASQLQGSVELTLADKIELMRVSNIAERVKQGLPVSIGESNRLQRNLKDFIEYRKDSNYSNQFMDWLNERFKLCSIIDPAIEDEPSTSQDAFEAFGLPQPVYGTLAEIMQSFKIPGPKLEGK